METLNRRPWQRYLRLSVRSLVVLVIVIGGWLGWIVHRARVQRDAVTAVERAGGKVMYDWEWQWKKGQPVRTRTTRCPSWLVEYISVDYLSNVTYADLRHRGSDELLEQIGQLHRLEFLRLAESPLTDTGVAHLQGLTALQWLSLADTKISDAGLAHLKGLTQLQTLLLDLTGVSDAGLPHLKPLTGLKTLSLSLTLVSDDAGEDLQRAMPGTRIAAGGWGAGRAQARAIRLYEKAANAKPDR